MDEAGISGCEYRGLAICMDEPQPVEKVCDWLNGLLGSNTIVATDAPGYDQDWLDTLFDAAGLEQQFRIFDFQVLTRDFSADQHRHLEYLLRHDTAPHRAADDALRLASKLMETHWGIHRQIILRMPKFPSFRSIV